MSLSSSVLLFWLKKTANTPFFSAVFKCYLQNWLQSKVGDDTSCSNHVTSHSFVSVILSWIFIKIITVSLVGNVKNCNTLKKEFVNTWEKAQKWQTWLQNNYYQLIIFICMCFPRLVLKFPTMHWTMWSTGFLGPSSITLYIHGISDKCRCNRSHILPNFKSFSSAVKILTLFGLRFQLNYLWTIIVSPQPP